MEKEQATWKAGLGHLQCTKASKVAPRALDASKEWKRVGSTSLGQCDVTLQNSDNCKRCPGLGSRILWMRGTMQMKACLIWFPFRLQVFVKACPHSGCVWQGVLWGASVTSHALHWQDVARQTAQSPINSRQQYLN